MLPAVDGLRSRAHRPPEAALDELPSAMHVELAARLPMPALAAMQLVHRDAAYRDEGVRLSVQARSTQACTNDIQSMDQWVQQLARLGLQMQNPQDNAEGALQRDLARFPPSFRAAELGHVIRHLSPLVADAGSLMTVFPEQQPLIRAALESVPLQHRDAAAVGYLHLLSQVVAQTALAEPAFAHMQEVIAVISQLPPQQRSLSLSGALSFNMVSLFGDQRVFVLQQWMPMIEAEPDAERRMGYLQQALNQWGRLPPWSFNTNSDGERLGQRLVRQALETAVHRPTEALASELLVTTSSLYLVLAEHYVHRRQWPTLMALIGRLPPASSDRTRLLEWARQRLHIHESEPVWADWARMLMEAPEPDRARLLAALPTNLTDRQWRTLQDAAREAVQAARIRHTGTGGAVSVLQVAALAQRFGRRVLDEPHMGERLAQWRAWIHAVEAPGNRLGATGRARVVLALLAAPVYERGGGESALRAGAATLTRSLVNETLPALHRAMGAWPPHVRARELQALAEEVRALPNPMRAVVSRDLTARLPQLLAERPRGELQTLEAQFNGAADLSPQAPVRLRHQLEVLGRWDLWPAEEQERAVALAEASAQAPDVSWADRQVMQRAVAAVRTVMPVD